MARTLRLRLAAGVLGAALAALAAVPAYAHDQLVSSTPPDGASVPAPRRVELVFSDVVLDRYGQLVVTGPDGRRYDRGAPHVLDNTIAVELAPLPVTGRYSAAYRIVSADGHPVTGQLHFTVTAITPGATAGAAEAPPAAGREAGSWPVPALLAAGVLAVVVLGAGTEAVRRRRGRGPDPADGDPS
jgi:methionine-rich copper-binding protein CopC